MLPAAARASTALLVGITVVLPVNLLLVAGSTKSGPTTGDSSGKGTDICSDQLGCSWRGRGLSPTRARKAVLHEGRHSSRPKRFGLDKVALMDLRREYLWSGTMPMSVPLTERVQARPTTATPRYRYGLRITSGWSTRGVTPTEVRRWAADLGVNLSVMDGITSWYPAAEVKWKIEGVGTTDGRHHASGGGVPVHHHISSVAIYPSAVSIDGLGSTSPPCATERRRWAPQSNFDFVPAPPMAT